ncbi:hypothetical protein LXL04_034974 [Taraxacum kok-saghyz]
MLISDDLSIRSFKRSTRIDELAFLQTAGVHTLKGYDSISHLTEFGLESGIDFLKGTAEGGEFLASLVGDNHLRSVEFLESQQHNTRTIWKATTVPVPLSVEFLESQQHNTTQHTGCGLEVIAP